MKRPLLRFAVVGALSCAGLSLAKLPSFYQAPAPEALGKFEADGKPATIVFPTIGPVTITPQKQSAIHDQRCRLLVRAGSAPPQAIMTMPTEMEADPDMVPTVCLSIQAFGRVSAPPGVYRIGVIYKGFSGYVLRPDNSYVAPMILFRTDRDGRWKFDDRLSGSLAAARIKSIPAMRAWIHRHRR